MLLLARIVKLVAGVVAAILVAGILLFVFEANQSNAVVEAVMDAGRWLSGPFHNLFELDSAKWQRAVNWGLAAIVYYAIGSIIARLLARAALAGEHTGRWHRGAHA
jgi:uncharacterized membrane protein YfcA